MERLIRAYFDAWLEKDGSRLGDLFEKDASYSECYGPEYFGLGQITEWFRDWNKRGKVLKWDIKQFVRQADVCAVEWYFECVYDGERSGFDGVSIIRFSGNGKISDVKEFESKAEHIYPYGKP